MQVLAPLGKKIRDGIVTRIVDRPKMEVKSIVQVNPVGSLLSPRMLELTKWTASYYFCSWGEAIKAALPAGLQTKPQGKVQLLTGADLTGVKLSEGAGDLLAHLRKMRKREASWQTLTRKFKGKVLNEAVRELENKGVISVTYSAGAERRTKSKPEIWEEFWQSYQFPEKKKFELSEEQKKVLEKIEEELIQKRYTPFLLHGVTGSGKTEVYLRACQKALELGRTTLILVPEISMSVQTIIGFKTFFGDKVIQLHSGLTERERRQAWLEITAGKYPIVIGARSAIFAPLENLGLIVVDEEQDSSYKQSDPAPRYNARDLALVRARLEKAVVILGSATPALESYYNAENGKYTLLKLTERIQKRPLAEVDIVDLKSERKNGNYGYISKKLEEKLVQKVEAGQQVILFLNRRGFSSLVKCQECGFVPICRNCNLTLTYHKEGQWLRCHFCGYQKKAPFSCPACNSLKFLYAGAGTQRIEAEIQKRAGEKSVRRLDSDVSAKRNYARNLLIDFQAGKFPVLLGTQMVTKGYDFPEVTLVGVISADISLELPDFRAGEKTFQLLTQVAGRSGRGDKPGQVLIQTYHPSEYAIQFAAQQDFAGFYEHEISTRRELGYPPFCHLILLLISGVNLAGVQKQSAELKQVLEGFNKEKTFALLGPAPAPIEKIRRKYRYRILLKTNQVFETLRILEEVLKQKRFESKKELRITVDVDPLDLL